MAKMVNLKQETLEVMRENGKTVEDIAWVGCDEFGISVDMFFELADTEYYDGFGGVEVAEDLQVVFKDNSALYRYEYDGAECWQFINLNKPSGERSDIIALTKRQVNEDDREFGYIDTSTLYYLNFGE